MGIPESVSSFYLAFHSQQKKIGFFYEFKAKNFAQAYAKTNNATQSAIEAGYSEKTAYSQETDC